MTACHLYRCAGGYLTDQFFFEDDNNDINTEQTSWDRAPSRLVAVLRENGTPLHYADCAADVFARAGVTHSSMFAIAT